LSGIVRLTLSLPLLGVLAALAVFPVEAQPRSSQAPAAAPEAGRAAAPATVPTPPTSRGENFSANKTPAQLFQSDCTGAGCHKGPGGLAKNSSSLGLAGFLREHYTNSRESAAALAAYLMGAANAPESGRPARGEPPAPRPPRNATRGPAGEETKPEEGQGPLTPARPRRQAAPGAPSATASAPPAGDNPPAIVRPEPGAAATPAAAPPPRNPPPPRGRPQHTAAPQPEPPPPAAAPAPPPPPPPPVVHDIFD
jgi:hypothetical protein